jgi:glyoxylase-like metal-dependent hydrolase (beta-lactamase superfamily II)/rhodanese-related sulfurtransferase
MEVKSVLQVEVIATEELGDRSYVAHDGSTAVVIDPQRDLDRVEAVLDERGLQVSLVCETHRHNDYATGGFALAGKREAQYAVPAGEDVVAEHHAVADGEQLRAGTLRVRAVGTPGHTDGHVSYVLDDPQAGGAPAVFTGGSLLYGSVGRPDLVAEERTEELAHAQYHSARKLAATLPDDAAVYPTHGFGSFCASSVSAGAATTGSTIGEQRAQNDALLASDEDAFARRLIANLTTYPAYYAHMSALNRLGPEEPDLAPPAPVDAEELRKRVADGEWVVDLRTRRAFAAGHVSGTVGIELANPFATYLGWLIPWGTPLSLIGESAEDVAGAQRQLVRIGIDHPAGASTEPVEELAGSEGLRRYRAVTFADLAGVRSERDGPPVLDVRRDDEWAAGHIAGAVHIPLHTLMQRLDEVPAGRPWVHCASGYRAGIAASLLDRAGHEVALIDDDYGNAEPAGLDLTM